jgi:hypothetical protein
VNRQQRDERTGGGRVEGRSTTRAGANDHNKISDLACLTVRSEAQVVNLFDKMAIAVLGRRVTQGTLLAVWKKKPRE